MSASLQIDALSIEVANETSSFRAVNALSLELASGDIACLLGPSGCGKTTLLRAIAGFSKPHTGRILLGGVCLSSPKSVVPPEHRGIGMVFQDYALFPHLTVLENLLFGLTQGRPRTAQPDQLSRAQEFLELVGMTAQAKRYPHELSGGQQQRVALARALVRKPSLMLLDEPFSNLDSSLRGRLARDVRDILKAAGTTAIIVTHDQAEGFAMADQMGVMFDGQLMQYAQPYEVYHEPCTPQVARFVGEGALITGTRQGHEVSTPLGSLPLRPCCCDEALSGEPVRVLLRPDDVVHDDDSPLQAKVVAKTFRGADFLYTLELANGEQVLSLVPSHHNHPLDQPIGIRLEADHVVTYAAHQQAQTFYQAGAKASE